MNPTLWSSAARDPEDEGQTHFDPVMEVWACWVEVFQPRRAIIDKVQRDIIRGALEVASVGECCTAIKELQASDYHQRRGKHANRPGKPYRYLRHALKGRPRRGESTRERIDWWLDMAEERAAEAPGSDLDRMNAQAERRLREQGLL